MGLWQSKAKPDTARPCTNLGSYEYDAASNRWVPVRCTIHGRPSPAAKVAAADKSRPECSRPVELTILNLNIWFSPFERERRFKSILESIGRLRPSVVCLQEVIPEFLTMLSECYWFKEHYVSPTCEIGSAVGDGSRGTGADRATTSSTEAKAPCFMDGYGSFIFVAKHLALTGGFQLLTLPTKQGRYWIGCEVRISRDCTLLIGTVHLESLNNRETRRKQLQVIRDSVMVRHRHSILCGDFNFDSDRNFNSNDKLPLENDALAELYPNHVDVWSQLRPGEPGKTFDTEANGMLSGHPREQMRYDRIIMHSNKNILIARSIDLTCNDPIVEMPPIWPSDHFGLLMTIEMKEK